MTRNARMPVECFLSKRRDTLLTFKCISYQSFLKGHGRKCFRLHTVRACRVSAQRLQTSEAGPRRPRPQARPAADTADESQPPHTHGNVRTLQRRERPTSLAYRCTRPSIPTPSGLSA